MKLTKIYPLFNLSADTCQQLYEAQQESAKVWNLCVQLHKECRINRTRWVNQNDLHKATKGKFALYSQSIQQVWKAFLGNIDATKELRRSHPKMRMKYPWRTKRFYPLIYPAQNLKYNSGVLVLPMGRGRKPIRLQVDIVQPFVKVQVVWNRGYELHVTHEASELPARESPIRATVDLGEIHTAAVTTNSSDGLIVTGRGIRCLKRYRQKMLRRFAKKLSVCQKYSKRWWKLTRAKWQLISRINRPIRDWRHKTWRKVVDWCKAEKVSLIFVGNPHGVRERNCGRKHNQRMSSWEYATDIEYLIYKAQLVGIKVIDGSERGTSSTCPVCGHRHKPQGRNWKCPKCGFAGHRDLVGSLNMHFFAFKEKVAFPNRITYLRPEKSRRSSGLGAVQSSSSKSKGQAPVSRGTHLSSARPKDVA